MPTKAKLIENSAGELYWNQAEPLGLPKVTSHTAGERKVNVTD